MQPKVSPTARPASRARYARYRVISQARPRGVSGPDAGLAHQLPCPRRDWCFRCAVTGPAGLDELGQVGLVTDPVPDKTQPAQGFLDHPASRQALACHHVVVRVRVVANQRRVDDGDPPDHFGNHGERPRLVGCPHLSQPCGGVTHRGDGPQQRAGPAPLITGALAVPRLPAGGTAKTVMLAPGRVQRPALLTIPRVGHRVMLRGHVSGEAAQAGGLPAIQPCRCQLWLRMSGQSGCTWLASLV